MPSVCFYFQVHQPYRLKNYRVFDIGNNNEYFNDDSERDVNNKKVLLKVARKSYLPTNAILLDLLRAHPDFKVSFSLSGVLMEQLEEYSPETMISFQKLVETGQVEILSETYFHSLSFLYSKDEFRKQVEMHKERVRYFFGVEPKVFRNTELIYNNDLAREVEAMGFKGVLSEGADHILGWRSPNFLYKPKGAQNIKLLLKNYRLSDDIAFRFSSRDWDGYPLDAPTFANWVSAVNGNGNVVNLFMDYETFGEHQWEDTGIFNFLKHLPGEILKHPDNNFVTPSEAIDRYPDVAELDVPHFISWADVERDLSAWLSNPIQRDAISKLYALEEKVLSTNDKKIINDWRRLQTSDHFYYMCTKWFSDGDVHKYFNPYESPYEAFISFMNVFNDLKLRIADRTINETEYLV
ncbi:MAG: alpha-amylase [Candidatus Yonathbacteria bacterium CG_4_10_14_3_um_filter_47_65]|uniref:Alpha-amylase n=2 Tax=Parcubacteria group TaxID=1794811 RepID=A0A2M8D6X8_9BACT|nr:MAG: alpha-amylase [Candidatus Nomurabacteria bacterium CG1_02_47_685]PIP03229.1 MAG: alpha-amylase [Candidatus Yonathbacteria bacterium CG23_combo_of_CG06-09_8_20_14_all_46_18]PIQ33088.1 MAG: alpha-amylase [Candidatus Yonathbacteria bacterium CG17_big_fil_post_rev_8_21_14_2_50_46_19]PIX56652.1 MAG: alpha-amylase [Candidatus Yonathbacteria bacterium CG_4_10_14_3_um_filter_47_65]PIY57798.1 MAG: alpha-amylase [Candidatus Yonathbacteria bacterium CG_4_10_14_0_8_um_filter_47_645]PJB82782.1 MAG: